MNRNRPNTQRGFTLTEILVAIAIFTIIMVAALLVYDRSNKVFKTGVESADMQQNTRVAFDRMVADLRMTGFDYDRDGAPSGTITVGSTTYTYQQQMDEQLEYIGPTAIVLRGNFDYNTGVDHGRENDPVVSASSTPCPSGYEPCQFPIVTTGNDEIVGYVLRSADSSKNIGSVQFYADVSKPRNVYVGGSAERQVTIPNVDLTNNNPPYTLYRVTLTDDNTASPVFTPLATNIRSMNFRYYRDPAGLYDLTDLTGAVIPAANVGTVVGGTGRYDPADPSTSVTPRAIRSKVQSIRLQLTGMNEARDGGYTDPTETVASAVNYRKYSVETLISPRNVGKRGLKEQDIRPPGMPTITQVCVGWCGNAYIKWTPPPSASGTGAPESYAVIYGTTANPTFELNVGNKLDAYVADLLDPGQTYYFALQAINSTGVSQTPVVGPYTVKNVTTPDAPSGLAGTGNGTLAALENKIDLSWTRPTDKSGTPTCSTGTPPSGLAAMPVSEIKGWRIERRLTGDTTWDQILNEDEATNKPIIESATNAVTWTDSKVGNCANYDYRVREIEGQATMCGDTSDTTFNSAGASGWSAFTSVAIGQSTSTVAPGAVVALTIDGTSNCGPLASDLCTIKLIWPKVLEDANGTPIETLFYRINIVRRHEDTPSEALSDAPGFPLQVDHNTWTDMGSGQLSYTVSTLPKNDLTDPLLPRSWRYFIDVQAMQCSLYGTASPQREFPCEIPGVSIATSPSIVIMGNGSPGNPWITSPGADINIAISGGTVDRITARLYSAAGVIFVGENSGALTSASFPWPAGVSDGVIYGLEVEVQKGTCVKASSYSITQTQNNCCLQPYADDTGVVIDSSVISSVTPASGDNFIRVRFKNNCSLDLTMGSSAIQIKWDSTKLSSSSGGRKMTSVDFPSTSSGTVSYAIPGSISGDPTITVSPTLVSGAKTVIAAGSTDYYIDIHFTSGFTTFPVTSVCILYSNTVGNDACRIVPSPAPTDGVCP